MLDCVECEFSYDEKQYEECPRCIELSQDRPELVAVAAITAQFITQAGSSRLDSKIGELWPENDDVCFKLITEVERKFKRKNKFHSYLLESNNSVSVPSRLQSYICKNIEFKTLVTLFMGELLSAARDAGAYKVAGGNIVFMHYKGHEEDDIGRFLAIMVTKKDGFDFDETNLVPKDSSHINLDALRQAALFDLTLFDEIYPAIPDSETYLKFIKGNSTGAFFKKAFGCDENNADNAESIEQIREAIADFQEKYSFSSHFYNEARKSVDSIIEKAAKNKESIPLTKLFDAVEQHIPDDSHVKGTFGVFVNENEYQINQHIEPTLTSAKKGKSISVEASDKSFSAEIVRKKVGGKGSGKSIEYHDGQIILNLTDEKVKQEFEKLVEANSDG
ncbi:MAG: nucleoid-associated protein [Thalassotalea sp.]|nr:nucleoid-associated protein [Thalassotalea sp.]